MIPFMWPRLRVILGVSSFVYLYACHSPTQAINEAAGDIARHARDSQSLASQIVEDTGEAETAERASEIVDHQSAIISEADEVRSELPGVQDVKPWWAQLIERGLGVAAILGVLLLSWNLGLGHLTKRLFWAIGWFIPESAMRSAATDMKAIDGNDNDMNFREAVAVRRTGDPAYEAARKKIKKQGRST